jgi:hypothetical protein
MVSLRSVVPLLTVVAGLAAWAVHSHAQPPAEQPEALPAPSLQSGRLQGIGGCAAAGCHNAPTAAGKAGTEYAVWVHDPHGQAFATLSSPLYKNILTRLKSTAYTEALCLKCHATPTPDGSPLPRDLLADGIGCESCHGPAEKWRAEHYKNSWKGLDPKQKESLYDFFPTKDLGRRIEKCAECHVGHPDKDVNHDLIAAGHPRLTFEYTAYHDLLPRHWRDKVSEAEPWEDKSKKFGNDFEAKAWLLGQAATAQATVKLTEQRAKLAGQPTHPWPEFTEYGCFACHHDLKPGDTGSIWRQKARYADTPPGLPPWGTWVRPMPETLARVAADWAPPAKTFADVAALSRQSRPDAKKAAGAVAALDAWRKHVDTASLDQAAVRKLLAAMTADGLKNPPRDWDDATQHYLGLAALYQSLGNFDAAAATPARRDLFLGLRKPLTFTDVPGDPKRRFDSPFGFTPEKYLQALQPFATEFRTPDAP